MNTWQWIEANKATMDPPVISAMETFANAPFIIDSNHHIISLEKFKGEQKTRETLKNYVKRKYGTYLDTEWWHLRRDWQAVTQAYSQASGERGSLLHTPLNDIFDTGRYISWSQIKPPSFIEDCHLAYLCVAMGGSFMPFTQNWLLLRANDCRGTCSYMSRLWLRRRLQDSNTIPTRKKLIFSQDYKVSYRANNKPRPADAFSFSVPMQVDALLEFVQTHKDVEITVAIYALPGTPEHRFPQQYTLEGFIPDGHSLAISFDNQLDQWKFFDCNIGQFTVDTKNKMKYILLAYGIIFEEELGHTWYWATDSNYPENLAKCRKIDMDYSSMMSAIETSVEDQAITNEITSKIKSYYSTYKIPKLMRLSILYAYAIGSRRWVVPFKRKLLQGFTGKVASVWGSKFGILALKHKESDQPRAGQRQRLVINVREEEEGEVD